VFIIFAAFYMSSFVAFRSQRICLAERSRSTFALFVALLCASFSVSLSVMPLTADSGKSRL
jgi:hypothetical protein